MQHDEHAEGSLEKGGGCPPRERNGNEAQLCGEIQEFGQAGGHTDSFRASESEGRGSENEGGACV